MTTKLTMAHSSPSRRFSAASHHSFNPCDLAHQALNKALRARSDLQLGFNAPVCPFDVAQRLGIEVQLQNIASMDGMYCRTMDGPVIVLASERPTGRQNFSCAHEIGHHVFGHGLSLDEMMEAHTSSEYRRHKNPEEFLADSFASFLLMPKAAVERAFAMRNLTVSTASPEDIFVTASYLGVGYRTLVTHLQWSLRVLNADRADELLRWSTKLSRVRGNLTGLSVKHVTVVDEAWEHRPVDLHTGDYLLVPDGWEAKGACLTEAGLTSEGALKPGRLFLAIRQGPGQVLAPKRDLPVRVAKQGFHGRSIFRHLDDPDNDEFLEGDDL